MAERGSCEAGSDTVAAGSEVGEVGEVSGMGSVSRMVTLRSTPRREPVAAPAWAPAGTGAWSPESTGASSVLPAGVEVPFAPDPEAAAFLNAPRRPLGFYVAPFGTPPFGNPPSRPAPGGSVDGPEWGPAYPAGA
ncbi:hypothetical protein [Actinomycetospora termitidis]|uniref:Uncharacterized protein n=1 Tax=Actinomycetospora termitidis TaxID=3053470 RepID=A0ABT7M4S1_9PSEU|nr:hypothetical protein [Actinomycetospora sp. Odt1-22]MDL5155678.1 hypothetical protein [Actinomycetospora sp. Odt1-22]